MGKVKIRRRGLNNKVQVRLPPRRRPRRHNRCDGARIGFRNEVDEIEMVFGRYDGRQRGTDIGARHVVKFDH